MIGVAVPIAVTVLSVLEFVQQSTCAIAALPEGPGSWAVIADLLAPAWAPAIIPIAGRLSVAQPAAAAVPPGPTAGRLVSTVVMPDERGDGQPAGDPAHDVD